MHAGAADQTAIDEGSLRLGCFGRSLAKSIWLELGVIGEEVFVKDFDFVVREVGFGEIRALFQHDHAKSVFGQFLGKNATGCAGPHDDKVYFVGGLVFRLLGGHDLALSEAPGAGCHPG